MDNKLPRPDYYEAVIQLRPMNKEVLRFIRNQVDKRNDTFISKEELVKTGVDIYITSQRFARTLGKKLKDNFKGELKITRTIFGYSKKRSRIVYRGTVLFRLKEEDKES